MTRDLLLAILPDVPRWVELRSLLRVGRGEVLGFRDNPLACAVADPAFGAAFVVGKPAEEAIGEALALAGPHGTLMTPAENCVWVSGALPELEVERAILHQLVQLPVLPTLRTGEVRHLAPGELETLPVPPLLQSELRVAEAAGTPIAAALAGDTPVAFCYAGSVTESLWDISIDTLAPWRRRGYATRAARFEIERFATLGLRPVWGAVESNVASRGLAQSLGFIPADELCIFSPPGPHGEAEI